MNPASTFPQRINIQLTNRCNMSCAMCTHDQLTVPAGDMDTALAKKILDEASENGVMFVSMQNMGESFLHPDIYELITYAHDLGIQQRLVTNGLKLDPQRLIDTKIERIAISINAFTKERYEKTRGKHWDKVLDNVKELWNLKNGVPEVEIHSELYRESDAWQKRFEEYWSEYANVITFSKLCEYPGTSYLDEETGKMVEMTDGEYNYKVCAEPFNSTLIKYNGDVVLCCVDDNHENVIGNVNNESLYDIWHNDKYAKVRRHMYRAFLKDVKPCNHCPLMRKSRQDNHRKGKGMTAHGFSS